MKTPVNKQTPPLAKAIFELESKDFQGLDILSVEIKDQNEGDVVAMDVSEDEIAFNEDGEFVGNNSELSGGEVGAYRTKKIRKFRFKLDSDSNVDELFIKVLKTAEKRLLSKRVVDNEGLFHVDFNKIKKKLTAGNKVENISTVSPTSNALLLLHGTFGNVDFAFKDLIFSHPDKDVSDKLIEKYGENTYCFEHLTAVNSVKKNTECFYSSLKKRDEPYVFDVITRSRGALVIRNILRIERMKEAGYSHLAYDGKRIEFGKVCMIAPVNQGTPLVEFVKDLLNVLVQIIKVESNPYLKAAGVLFTILAYLYKKESGRSHLLVPGLWDMIPGSEIINDINQSERQENPAQYLSKFYILAGNFEPAKDEKRKFDPLIDSLVFKGKYNDRVAPTSMDTAFTLGAGTVKDGNCYFVASGPTHEEYFKRRPDAEYEFVWNTLLGNDVTPPTV